MILLFRSAFDGFIVQRRFIGKPREAPLSLNLSASPVTGVFATGVVVVPSVVVIDTNVVVVPSVIVVFVTIVIVVKMIF